MSLSLTQMVDSKNLVRALSVIYDPVDNAQVRTKIGCACILCREEILENALHRADGKCFITANI